MVLKLQLWKLKVQKHLSSFCFFPISSCSLPEPLEGVHVQICRNYPATPTTDTSHQLRLTLNWVSLLQLTYYCNISIYLLCMCIHTDLHAHPVRSRFSPSVMWILGTELLSSGLCDKCFIQWAILLSILLLLLVCFLFLRQGLTTQPYLTWNMLCEPS